jgi:hypothetical protein
MAGLATVATCARGSMCSMVRASQQWAQRSKMMDDGFCF